MTTAVARLRRAITSRERILIYGDYDVDGTTAVVILQTAIAMLGGQADFHVPHRIKEGYGIREDVLERAKEAGISLVISVDTGMRAFAAAEAASMLGLDLIVTDHHLPQIGEKLPRALAVLNPSQSGCPYPCKFLCGAGVAFKLAQALLEAEDAQRAREKWLPSFLKMVAIATIADAVPLSDENRVIAKLGLAGLRDARNPGLRSLLRVCELQDKQKNLTANDIAFRVAPRINAAGRMDVAQDVVELFSCKDIHRAHELAAKLNQLNAERQQTEQAIMLSIEKRLEGDPALREAYCLVIDGEAWHRGVIGITASRVVERTGKPALVISRDGDQAHGSGRSILAFHLLEALESCRHLFTRFGGHAFAVGFALPCARIEELRNQLDCFARTKLTLDDFEPSLNAESEIELAQITPQLLSEVRQLEPFGIGNPEPIFLARGVRCLLPPKVLKERHIKLRVAQENGGFRSLDALGWRMAEEVARLSLSGGDFIDIAFKLDENTHPDFGGLQLSLCDVKRAQTSSRPSLQVAAAERSC